MNRKSPHIGPIHLSILNIIVCTGAVILRGPGPKYSFSCSVFGYATTEPLNESTLSSICSELSLLSTWIPFVQYLSWHHRFVSLHQGPWTSFHYYQGNYVYYFDIRGLTNFLFFLVDTRTNIPLRIIDCHYTFPLSYLYLPVTGILLTGLVVKLLLKVFILTVIHRMQKFHMLRNPFPFVASIGYLYALLDL